MKMNLGCGPIQPEGWVNVDVQDLGQDILMDARDGLRYDAETFELVFMNHSLQQFTTQEIPPLLLEIHRVLDRGGRLRVLVPDVMRAFAAYHKHDKVWFPNAANHHSLDETFCEYVTWYSSARTQFTLPWLEKLLRDAGFKPMTGRFGDCELDDRQDESIIAVGVKM